MYVIGVDEERQAGIEYGGDGVGHDGDRVAMIVCAKMLEFSLGEDISGIGKGRHPCSINEHGITAAMVKVQVRAEHVINAPERPASGPEAFQVEIVSTLGREKVRRYGLV